MWPLIPVKILQDTSSSFSINLLQGVNAWQYFYWIASPVAVIFASITAIWFSRRRDRIESNKKKDYFEDVLLFLYIRMNTYIETIEYDFTSLKEKKSNDLLQSCVATTKDLNNKIGTIILHCPSRGVASELLFLAFEYNGFIERIEKFPEKYDLANCTPEDGIKKAARDILDTIIEITKAISGKKKWYHKLLRKQSLYEYIQEQQASADSSQTTK